MPLTRSASRSAIPEISSPQTQTPRKRKSKSETSPNTQKLAPASKKAKITPLSESESTADERVAAAGEGSLHIADGAKIPFATSPAPSIPRYHIDVDPEANIIPGQLTFSFEDAKAHLIAADSRFATMFEHVKCVPFEEVEAIEPFKTLTTSILGQQISWLAARSIKHRFLRLFNPDLPEEGPKVGDPSPTFFPRPNDVASESIETLRTAGLSQRKAEYIVDLAKHFDDGRLSAAKLVEWSEQEVEDNLVAVRGIGKWTVHMFAMFQLRRPDVLATGDLGLQKGLLRWVLASHGVSELTISPKKLKAVPNPDEAAPDPVASGSQSQSPLQSFSQSQPELSKPEDASALPPVSNQSQVMQEIEEAKEEEAKVELMGVDSQDAPRTGSPEPVAAAVSNSPSTPLRRTTSRTSKTPKTPKTPKSPKKKQNDTPGIPPIPLIAKDPVELPEGMTVGTLKSRLEGKKVKGQYLTPGEMDQLTSSWAPYRSLGCFYLWALTEAPE